MAQFVGSARKPRGRVVVGAPTASGRFAEGASEQKMAKRGGRGTRTREEEQIAQVDYPDSTNLHHAAVFPIARAAWPERYLASSDLEEISLGGAGARAHGSPSFSLPQPEIN